MYKKCPGCQEVKTLDEYYKLTKSKHKVQGYCKECQKTQDKEYRKTRKEHGPSIVRHDKVCATCNTRKPISQFGKRTGSADGYLSYCKPCWGAYVKKAQAKAKRVI